MHISVFNYKDGSQTLEIGFITFERQWPYERVASVLYDEHRGRLQALDAIVLRPPVDVPLKKISRKSITTIIKRFKNSPLYILYSCDYKIYLSENLNDGIRPRIKLNKEANFVGYLRKKELEEFIIHSSALIKSPRNTVFRMPSQEYSHTFLRVGNIQIARHVMDAVFFWTIPYLKTVGSILTDSWTISSIALNLARLLSRYDKNVKVEDFHVNMLASHFDGRKTMDRNTRDSLFALSYGNEKGILFLISAVKTEKSLDNINRAFGTLKLPRLEYLAIYKLIETASVESLCHLDKDFCEEHDVIFDSLSQPNPGEKVVEIDSKVFFPVEIVESQLEVDKKCTVESAEFFRKYEGKQVIYVHRDSFYINKTRFRHHGIYLDVSKMLTTNEFVEKVKTAIDTLEQKPSLIIYPPHEHGRDFIKQIKIFLSEKFGEDIPQFEVLDSDFSKMNSEDNLVKLLKSKKGADFILIADDVSTTGSRLRGYQETLRTLYKGRIGYIVGVARPDTNKRWERTVRDLSFRPRNKGEKVLQHQIIAIEKVIIPNWDEKECPWCLEKKCIERSIKKPLTETKPANRILKERYFKLMNAVEVGLLNDVFVSIGPGPKPAFQGGSIFADKKEISDADLVAIVAAGIQSIRNNGASNDGIVERLETEYPHFKIIKIDNYLGSQASFNEVLLKAVLFRVAYKHELHATTDENVQKQKINLFEYFKMFKDNPENTGFFNYELYLVLKERKLPKPDIDQKLFSLLEVG